MKISGRDFLRNISEFFSRADYETEMLIMLLIPICVIVAFVLFMNNRRSKADLFNNIPEKDLEFIETVRLQKGLEEFDRDFILEMALTFKAKPGYIFIDLNVFKRVEQSLRQQLIEEGSIPEDNQKYQHLCRLQKKMFPGQ